MVDVSFGMPRQARLDFPGSLHHIINRGIEKRRIFSDKRDYAYFIEQLGKLVIACGVKCYGWVLMPNHFHLLVMTGKISISKFMSRLQTRYAGYFNKKYKRSGRLFQNRFKSILCDEDIYLKELVAYIHLNPLRAGLVTDLEALDNYPWSGHRMILGQENFPWQETDEVLAQFGETIGQARRNYKDYLQSRREIKKDYSGGGLIRSAGGWAVVAKRKRGDWEMYDSRVLGGGDFVESILRQVQKEWEQEVTLRKMSLELLIKKVMAYRQISAEELAKNGKTTQKGAEGRALIMYLGKKYFNESISDISKRFQIGQSAGSRLYQKGEILAQEEKEALKTEVDIII